MARRYLANRPLSVAPGHKWCLRCEKIKPAEEFGKNSASTDGYTRWCRTCYSHYQHDRYLARKTAGQPTAAANGQSPISEKVVIRQLRAAPQLAERILGGLTIEQLLDLAESLPPKDELRVILVEATLNFF